MSGEVHREFHRDGSSFTDGFESCCQELIRVGYEEKS